jgi:hypothetical protein
MATDPVVADTVLKAIVAMVKDSAVVGARVWRAEAVPESSRITYPYVTVLPLVDASPWLSGDGGTVQHWREQFQIDLYHKKGPTDPAVLRALVDAFRTGTAVVAGEAIRFTMVGVARPPSPDPKDMTTRDTMTIAAFYPVAAI